MQRDDAGTDLPRTTLQLLFIGVLIASSCWILSPFLTASSWAGTIVVATWPILLHIQSWLGNRRGFAVAVMTLILLLVLLVPLYFGISAIVENAERIPQWSQSLTTLPIPQPPGWVEGLPGIGPPIAVHWREIAAAGREDLATRLAPYARATLVWFVAQVGNVGMLFLQFLLTVVIAAILYANGETTTRGIDRFAVRLAGPRGKNAVHLAAQAVRAVALGVVLTAGIQSALCGIGLAVAGVPFAVILTAAMFMLGVAQIGPMPILIPTIVWVYWAEGTAWGTVFLIWAIFCGVIDNVIRPLLIKRGAHLPLLLIFGGVIGGLIAIGVIGLFIGPVVLAVAYTLLADWVSGVDEVPQPV